MTKTHKAVLSTLAVLCLLFMGSGVAQAQECFAFPSGANTVRAEGMTEAVGSIQLQCRAQDIFGQPPIGAKAVISITLNTQITNATDDEGDMVMGLTYTDGDVDNPGDPALGNAGDYTGAGKEVFSDGNTITWTISTNVSDGILFPDSTTGSTVTIGGIMANASALGDGEDVTAEVRVNGVMIDHSPIKLADVTTGLDITVTSVTGLQCESGSAEMATIKFVEGFASAIRDTDSLVVAFRGIPEGVTVTPSMMGTGMALDMADDTADPPVIAGGDLAPLTLVTEGEMSGLDEDGNVALSVARAGQIVYTFDDEDADTPVLEGTDPMKAKEWNELGITFTWKAGEPTLNTGSVTVSYHPVTDDVTKRPRYVSGPTNDVIEIEDCTTTLLFPFVTNQEGYNTGLAITNASDGKGYCTIEYSGSVVMGGVSSDAPDDMMTPEQVAGGGQWVNTLSTIAPGFQGYITASCEFRDAYGFAFITDAEADLAQGYLAVCTNCD